MRLISGRPGELVDRLVELVDRPEPQLRAVATTLLVKALDRPADEAALIEHMVASDRAASMVDAVSAGMAALALRDGLSSGLSAMVAEYGEAQVARALRDHLDAQIRRWAARAVDDADGRRRAERLLAWADRPEALEAAQRRGLFAGMDADELRRLAGERLGAPVTPETALAIWSQSESWTRAADRLLGEDVIAAWEARAGS